MLAHGPIEKLLLHFFENLVDFYLEYDKDSEVGWKWIRGEVGREFTGRFAKLPRFPTL